MKRTRNFMKNPALTIGMALLLIGVIGINVLELEGLLNRLSYLACGAGTGLAFIGLLYASPKTRPLFKRFHDFKQRMTDPNKDD